MSSLRKVRKRCETFLGHQEHTEMVRSALSDPTTYSLEVIHRRQKYVGTLRLHNQKKLLDEESRHKGLTTSYWVLNYFIILFMTQTTFYLFITTISGGVRVGGKKQNYQGQGHVVDRVSSTR